MLFRGSRISADIASLRIHAYCRHQRRQFSTPRRRRHASQEHARHNRQSNIISLFSFVSLPLSNTIIITDMATAVIDRLISRIFFARYALICELFYDGLDFEITII